MKTNNRIFWLRSIAFAVPFAIAAQCGQAWSAGERVGTVTTVQPSATITPSGAEPAIVTMDSAVSMADIVRTDIGGFVKIDFRDGSQLTVNPGSNVTIDEFVYNDSTNAGSLVISVGSGVARFVSGNMKKEGIKLRTTSATMGLRGTDVVIRSDGVNSEVEVMDGGILLAPCGSKEVYAVDKGQIVGVDYSCAVTVGAAGVSGGSTSSASAAAGPGPGPGDEGGPSDGPSGGPGNGNGNDGNAGNGGGNTGGSGPGTGNGGGNGNGNGNGGGGGGAGR